MRNFHRAASIVFFCAALAACGSPHDQGPVDEEQTHETPIQTGDDSTKQTGFQVPNYNPDQLKQVLALYKYVDPFAVIPQNLKDQALTYFHANLANIKNQNYLSVVDFSMHSSQARFFIIDMKTGAVKAYHVAHGKGSDPNNTGYATRFSNVSGSEKSSLGYYEVSETYDGAHGYSARLDGLSSTNSAVRARAIVIHGASYVYDSNTQAGRSWGCLAVPMNDRDTVVNALHGGSILFAALEK